MASQRGKTAIDISAKSLALLAKFYSFCTSNCRLKENFFVCIELTFCDPENTCENFSHKDLQKSFQFQTNILLIRHPTVPTMSAAVSAVTGTLPCPESHFSPCPIRRATANWTPATSSSWATTLSSSPRSSQPSCSTGSASCF